MTPRGRRARAGFERGAGQDVACPLAIDERWEEDTLFRIFQEMLSNVGRHARAAHLRIDISRQGDELQMTVEDDGVGAPPQAFEAADAYGIMGMRERARHFGGRLDIVSEPGEGTRMRLRVQLPVPSPEGCVA